MFRKSLVWAMVLGIVLVISSGALAKSNFFGIQILDPSKAQEAFSKVVRTKDGGVRYTHKSKLANDSVYCWGTVGNYWITFQIHNDSKRPIQMNYFMDKYELMSVERSIYELELPDILDYPSKAINPKGSRTIKVSNPLKNLTEVKYLSVSLSWGEVFIFLRRIEEEE